MYGGVLLLHVLGATVWTGGHLVLAATVLPRSLRDRDCASLLRFESAYERIGMPALLLQVITGPWLAHRIVPDFHRWLDFADPLCRPIATKLVLLALTATFAVHARLRVLPHLSSGKLVTLAWHVYPVTAASVLFVVAGVSFRTGWLY